MPPRKLSKAARADRRAFKALPRKDTLTRDYHITRSTAAGAILYCLPYTPHKPFLCIVCQRRFITRKGVETHFHTHRAIPRIAEHNLDYDEFLPPFADQSCWPEPAVISSEEWHDIRERLGEIEGMETPEGTEEYEELVREYRLVARHAQNEGQIQGQKAIGRLRMWEWWFVTFAGAEDGMLRRVMARETEDFRVTGDVGVQNQDLRVFDNTLAHAPNHITVATKIKTVNGSGPAAYQNGGESADHEIGYEFFEPFEARSDVERLTSADELPTNGPLNAAPILAYISKANMTFTAREGETDEGRVELAYAAIDFLRALGADDRAVEIEQLELADYDEDTSIMDDETEEKDREIFYMHAFRHDRGEIFRILHKGVKEVFAYEEDPDVEEDDNEAEFGEDRYEEARTFERTETGFGVVMTATIDYVSSLGDDDAEHDLQMYAHGDRGRWCQYMAREYGQYRE